MKRKIFLFTAVLLIAATAAAQDHYCHSWLWGGELTFQSTGSDLKALANHVVNQCKLSVGMDDSTQCVGHLSCCFLDGNGRFQSVVDNPQKLIDADPAAASSGP